MTYPVACAVRRENFIARGKRGCIVAALWLTCCVAGAVDIDKDDAGRTVRLPRPVRRVITLAPHLTELLFAVGAGESLVGADRFSDAPPEMRNVERIGDANRIDVERVLRLKPDLVLAWHRGATAREIGQLEAAGVSVLYLDPQSVGAVADAIERLGHWLGRLQLGRARAVALRSEWAALRNQAAGQPPVRVFFQVWSTPPMTVNKHHFIDDVLRGCGGQNVFADQAPLVPSVSTESVLAADPEVILTARERGPSQHAAQPGWERDPSAPEFRIWQGYRAATAIKRRWMFTLDGDLISRQGPRLLDAARSICQVLSSVREERLARP